MHLSSRFAIIRTMKSDSVKTKRCSKIWVAKLLLLSLIFASLVLIANKSYLRLLIRGHLDYARAHGYPTTMAELYAFYEYPPPGENAADLYLEAFDYFVEWDEEDQKLVPFIGEYDFPPPGEYMDEPTLQLVSQYLADNKEALILLHRAVIFPQCRYPVETELSYIQAIDHLGAIRHGAMLLALESMNYANVQQLDLCAQSLLDSFALSNSLGQEPLFSSMGTRKICDALNISILEDILNLTDITDRYLVDLKNVLTAINYDYELKRAMIGEYVKALNLNSFFFESGRVGDFRDRSTIFWDSCIGTYDRAQIQCLNSIRDCFVALSLPYSDRIHNEYFHDDLMFMSMSGISDIRTLLDVIVIETKSKLRRAMNINSRYESSRRVTIMALAIEQYRHEHKNLPDSLNELVPDYINTVLKDPYDDQDLRYKKLEKGYVVYSVGEDCTDNHGKKEDANGIPYAPGTDITITVRR